MIELLQADGKTVAVAGNEFYVNAAKNADATEADADVVIQVAVPAQTTVELCSTEAQAILSQENCIAIFGSNQTAAEGVLAANANLNVLGSDAGAGDVIGVGFDAGSIIKAAVTDGTNVTSVYCSECFLKDGATSGKISAAVPAAQPPKITPHTAAVRNLCSNIFLSAGRSFIVSFMKG